MSWIREVIVDILVTLFIGMGVWLGDPWMWWIIAVYTALLLVAKGLVLTGEGFLARTRQQQSAPDWFLHLLYAVNVALLAIANWWILLTGWAAIWLFSYLGQRRQGSH